jgi:hypothetical protein
MMTRYLYVISDGENFKIGITRQLDYRLRTLQTGNPRPLKMVAHFEHERIPADRFEFYLHKFLAKYRLTGEWFDGAALRVQMVVQTLREQRGEWYARLGSLTVVDDPDCNGTWLGEVFYSVY